CGPLPDLSGTVCRLGGERLVEKLEVHGRHLTLRSREQRLSLVTLGVADLARARAFYEGLGWRSGAAPADDVVFFQAGTMIVALWGRDQLAEDNGGEDARRC